MKKYFNKENKQLSQRRLSLKSLATTNLMSDNGRFSVQINRNSLSGQSFLSNLNESQTLQTTSSKFLKKQSIITNLMKKLDHQQDLKSIIKSKLNKNIQIESLQKISLENQQYYLQSKNYQKSNQKDVKNLIDKLKICQKDIINFKNIIKNLSEKITQLTNNDNTKIKKYQDQEVQTICIETDESKRYFYENLDNTLKILNGNRLR